jgi:oligopeptide/dipeptide ABC transporter ATP-binding protein
VIAVVVIGGVLALFFVGFVVVRLVARKVEADELAARSVDLKPGELSMGGAILKVEDLAVSFATEDGVVQAVDGVSFEISPGETVGIVGESGSGKSVTNLSILGLTRADNATITGKVLFEGNDLVEIQDDDLRSIRGNDISMIFQDPLSSLHPFYKVGAQLIEAIQVHRDVSDADAKARSIELLGLVGIPDAERRFNEYPHEFSGGMRQRVMIAMALTNDPKVLIADEPTTALDVTTQAQILRLLESLRQEFGMAVVMITHDLGVIAEIADRVLVMYAGKVVESGTLDELFYNPQHPYTWGLLGSLTRTDRPRTARLAQIAGQPPSLVTLPEGCAFRPRCPHAFDKCTAMPPLEVRGGEPDHKDRCWLEPDRKRELRTVADGEFGLEAPNIDRDVAPAASERDG